MAVLRILFVTVLAVGIKCSTIGSETEKLLTCSKYHFEEKVLEKLVRIEHRIDIYNEKLTKWEERLSFKIDKFEESEKEREITLKSLREAVLKEQSDLNDSYVDVLTDIKSQLAHFLQRLTVEHRNLTTKWDNAIQQTISELNESDRNRDNDTEKLHKSSLLMLNSAKEDMKKQQDQMNMTFKDKITEWDNAIQQTISELNESERNRTNDTEKLHKSAILMLDSAKEDMKKHKDHMNMTFKDKITDWKKLVTNELLVMDLNDAARTVTVNSLKDSVLTVVETHNASVSKALSELSDREAIHYEEQKERITNMKDEMQTPAVLFKARNLQFDTNLKGRTIVFNSAMFNRGNGYDTTTGIFTAPTAGTYLFTIQLCPEDGFYIEVRITTNNGDIGMLHTQNNFGRDGPCVSADGISILADGDKVWITCYDVTSDADALYNPSVSINGNNFSGVLLHTGTS